MVSRDTKREKAIEAISGHLLRTGLGETGIRQLAAAAGTSDRMLLYYFANKEEVMAAALSHLAGALTAQLEASLPAGQKRPAADLFRRAAALTGAVEVRPFMSLWMDILAAGQRGEAPYRAISEGIAGGFLRWIEDRLEVEDGADGPAQAAMVLAMVDGLAVLHASLGQAIRDRAVDAFVASLSN